MANEEERLAAVEKLKAGISSYEGTIESQRKRLEEANRNRDIAISSLRYVYQHLARRTQPGESVQVDQQRGLVEEAQHEIEEHEEKGPIPRPRDRCRHAAHRAL
jgi:hypothetical protein